MAHPYNSMRADKIEHSRVGAITKACGGGAMGGATSPSGMSPMAINRKRGGAVMRAAGGEVKQRADRPGRAFGGRTGKKKKSGKGGNHVNVIVQAHKPAMPAMPPMASPAPPMMPPKPPMMPPPAGPGPTDAPPGVSAGPMPPPGALPGMPMRKRGGSVFSGSPGKVSMTARGMKGSSAADADTAGIGVGRTPVQPAPNKQDGKTIGRKPVITKATGGPISSSAKGEMSPASQPSGAAGGKFRQWWTGYNEKKGYGSETRNAKNPTRNP